MSEYQSMEEIVRDLISPELSRVEFIERWVDFAYGVFPSFDLEDVDHFLALCKQDFLVDGEYCEWFDDQHSRMLDTVSQRLSPSAGIEFSVNVDNKGELLLDGLCSTFGEEGVIVFARLFDKSGEDASRSLLRFQVKYQSENLSEYLQWLKFRKIFDYDKWKLDPIVLPSAHLPVVANVPEAIGSALSTRFTEEAWEGAPVVPKSTAKRFPLLQAAVNRISTMPEFETVKPIMGELVKQIIANGGGLNRHLVLLGPSGVGKSESAKILSYVLHGLGVAGPGMDTYLPAEKSERYVGYSEFEMGKILDRLSNHGGVLIVDEASSLYDGKRDSSANFRQRAAQVVQNRWQKLLEDKVVVIFAGYRQGFEDLMATDEGWGRRLMLIDIEPPTVDRMVDRVLKSLNEEGIFYPESLSSNVTWLFQDMIEEGSGKFGYWGTVENFTLGLKASIAGDPLFGETQPKNEINADDFESAARSIGYVRKDISSRWIGSRGPVAPVHVDLPDSIGDLGWDEGPAGSTGMSPDR